jgi:diguanylate cyclase (GGDEF)-like protein
MIASLRPFARFGWSLVVQEDYDAALAPVADAVRAALLPSLLAVVLASAGAFVLGAWGVRPLLALAEAARRLADGDGAVSVPDAGTVGEVRTLARAFNHMALRLHENRVELEARNSELETANEVLEQLSITDGLTKLHNHRYFQDQYAREARRAQRTGAPLSLVLIDIDCFKPLNDELGHAAGDQVLARVAQVMSMEIRETDTLARYGGEEFALIAPATELEGAIALAEKIRGAVSDHEFPVFGPEGPVRITVSLGVAVFDGDTSHTFRRADAALYEAKSGGRDCVRWSGDEDGVATPAPPA